jgi:hypothetical protein
MIEIVASGIARDEAGKVSRKTAVDGFVPVHAARQPKAATGAVFFVGAADPGCACRLLNDHADAEVPFNTLRREVLTPFEKTLRLLFDLSGELRVRGAWLEGTWRATPSRGRRVVTLAALLKDVRAARLEDDLEYQVCSHAA